MGQELLVPHRCRVQYTTERVAKLVASEVCGVAVLARRQPSRHNLLDRSGTRQGQLETVPVGSASAPQRRSCG